MNYHKDAKCSKCAYFFAVFRPSEIAPEELKLVGGQCRKNPPSSFAMLVPKERESIEAGGTVVTPVIERVTTVPHVAADFWCGEFKAVVA